ncbi:antibiotic biosynthesis monooxygenase family protein [Arcticibacterium luteifluviistationis]|uniref:Antibiotic biosynthesis monooxygenase n=1 Tax=Arcticibacterium luteifluviistationis TaxID=1784714 RepID=A0A2Z4GGA4_9BACT|nr:antibiotic biosynthesis monooxygenase [Arcticibacterium luteifluviistationis]AWW00430.1 antibiotic biosynthesis monooxygenase [Arcticibacterium luteifluviistationis]
MILEIATLDIKNEELKAFEAILPKAKAVISQSKGFVSIEFQNCIETSTKYLALIKWETLEDHTIGFRESPLFQEWRAVLSPFFNSAPNAEHFKVTEVK